MAKAKKWVWIAGGGVATVAVVGTVVLVARANKKATLPTPPAFLAWPEPASYSENNLGMIGPNAGNAPNGIYQVAQQFTAPVSGKYTFSVWADDFVVVAIDGVAIGSAMGSLGARSGSVTLAAGTHVLVATVANNDLGNATWVPYRSGSPNPTAFYCKLVSPTGGTVVTTKSPAGWHYSGYTSALQVTTARVSTVSPFGS